MTLIGYWPLNEHSGDKAYDYSGNENHGVLKDQPIQGVEGVVGSTSYEFGGNGEGVDLTDFELPGEKITVSLWGSKVNTSNYYSTAFGHYDSEDNGLKIFLHGHGSPRVHFGGSGLLWRDTVDNHYVSNTLRPVGTLHNVVLTFDGSTIKTYVDGVLVWDHSHNHLGSPNALATIGYPTYGGVSHSGHNHEGRVQELRVYNRALSRSEIQYLYSVSQRGRFISQSKKPE